MREFLATIWNLPAHLLERATGANLTFRKLHRGCGGEWLRRDRAGRSYERCSKCGAERGARQR